MKEDVHLGLPFQSSGCLGGNYFFFAFAKSVNSIKAESEKDPKGISAIKVT